MVTTTQKERNIKYLNRDFESYKRDLNEHLKIFFPTTHKDFNEASVGIMLSELVAFTVSNGRFGSKVTVGHRRPDRPQLGVKPT